MTATTATITIQGHRVQVTEQILNDLNEALSSAPAAADAGYRSEPNADLRLALVPTITVKTVLTNTKTGKITTNEE
jgi:hypothetical protein